MKSSWTPSIGLIIEKKEAHPGTSNVPKHVHDEIESRKDEADHRNAEL
jgi:hypothetical protein